MKKLISKSCHRCGTSVEGIKRKDRNSFYYPKYCDSCKYPESSEELKQFRRDLLAKHRRISPVGATRLHKTGTTHYVLVRVSGKKRWVYQHRIVAEQTIGRPLAPGEVVHHINKNTLDNRPENLKVMQLGDHTTMHLSITTWSIKYDRCQLCKTTERKHMSKGLCTACYQREKSRERGHWPIRH